MMAARIKTMNHFSPKLRPPDIISKYQSEISEVIHSLIRSPQCYQMPPHQTSWCRVERYFISSSVDIFRSGAGRWVLEGGWVGRWLQGPGMETIKRKNSHILGMRPTTIWYLPYADCSSSACWINRIFYLYLDIKKSSLHFQVKM